MAGHAKRLTLGAGVFRACYLPVAILLAGCYRYVPTAEPQPGRIIRAELSESGSESLVRQLGPGVTLISGTFLNRYGDEFSLLVEEFESARSGTQILWNEAVRVPANGIERLQERKIDGLRSALFGAGLAASASLAFVALGLDELLFSSDPDPDPGPTEMRSRPRVRFGLFLPVGAGSGTR
jgi:hypothetical protein